MFLFAFLWLHSGGSVVEFGFGFVLELFSQRRSPDCLGFWLMLIQRLLACEVWFPSFFLPFLIVPEFHVTGHWQPALVGKRQNPSGNESVTSKRVDEEALRSGRTSVS